MPSVLTSMTVLALIGLVDSISYMAVAPSLIFYVLQAGGDKEAYGLILSAFSFASFCGKPLYGIWVDKEGNKFRAPYIASFVSAIVGAILYFSANGITDTTMALVMTFVGRLFSGLGGANQALGYAYIASVVPQDQQTRTNTILSMTRIIGMALGPVVNVLLAEIDTSINIWGFLLPVDPLNSVGLLLAAGNLFVLACLILFLEEPPEKKKIPDIVKGMDGGGAVRSEQRFWKAACCIEIVLPNFILLVVNSSFQLIETAFPAAAADGLGWGPIETSAVLGSTSIVIFFSMVMTVFLSGKMHDLTMVAIGHILWIFGGSGIYLFWKRNAPVSHYAIPLLIAYMGFPFIAASNRSNFTKAVASKPELEDSLALMQSVLSMSASVAGFVTPGFVAAYVIRTPEQVTASGDNRELTPIALYVPILPCIVLVALWYCYRKERALLDAAEVASKSGTVASEETGLLLPPKRRETRRSSVVAITQAFSRQSVVNRRISGQIMGGLTVFDTADEKELNNKWGKDLLEWEELAQMDYNEHEDDTL